MNPILAHNSSNSPGLAWLLFSLSTVVCWGLYGVFLHSGQTGMNDPVNGRYKAFLFVGVYSDPALAREDLEVVRDLHAAKIIGTYDAAVATKDEKGVHVTKWEKPTQHGAWTGVAVGAVLGIIFPPSIIGTALVGGVAGGLIGHFWRGMSRKDVKELGEMLDEGEAALIVIGRDRLDEQLMKAELKADKQMEKEIKVDAKELDKDLAEAEKEMAAD